MSSWYVIKDEPCDMGPNGKCWPWIYDRCVGCLGDGTRLDVTSAIPVERVVRHDDMENELFDCFVPVESSSSGEGGDQWPEATGDTVRENTEVAPSESVRLVAEAPEGTQPPGLSDGDER